MRAEEAAERAAAAGVAGADELPENMPLVEERAGIRRHLKKLRKTIDELKAVEAERGVSMPTRKREALKEALDGEKEMKARIAELNVAMLANKEGDTLRKLCGQQVDDFSAVKALCSNAQTVNSVSYQLQTALHKAAMYDNAEVVGILISAGADVNLADQRGWTALMFAASNGHVASTKLLMAAGTQLDLVSGGNSRQAGMNALHLAAHYAHADVCALLIESKLVDTSSKTAEGKTPLDLAKARKSKDDESTVAVIKCLQTVLDAELKAAEGAAAAAAAARKAEEDAAAATRVKAQEKAAKAAKAARLKAEKAAAATKPPVATASTPPAAVVTPPPLPDAPTLPGLAKPASRPVPPPADGNAHWRNLRRLSNAANAAKAFEVSSSQGASTPEKAKGGSAFSFAAIVGHSNNRALKTGLSWLRAAGESISSGFANFKHAASDAATSLSHGASRTSRASFARSSFSRLSSRASRRSRASRTSRQSKSAEVTMEVSA